MAQNPGRITGIVLNEDGVVVDDATVCLSMTSGNNTGINCLTPTSHGQFQIEKVQFGNYELFAINNAEGYAIENQSPGQKITLTAENPSPNVTIRLRPRGAVLSGTVRDKTTGEPAEISTHFDRRLYATVDAADRESCRPDFAIPIYPGHLWTEEHFDLNPRIRVTRDTPPTFLLQAENDPVDSVKNSLAYFAALQQAGVPAEMHLYAQGGHAFGLRRTGLPITEWPGLVERWLRTIGVTPK